MRVTTCRVTGDCACMLKLVQITHFLGKKPLKKCCKNVVILVTEALFFAVLQGMTMINGFEGKLRGKSGADCRDRTDDLLITSQCCKNV